MFKPTSNVPAVMKIRYGADLELILQSIASKHGTTKVDVISRAFALLELAHTATAQSKRIGILDEHNNFDEIKGI